MAAQTTKELRDKKCEPCEGGVLKMSRQQAQEQLRELSGWKLGECDGVDCLRKSWVVRDFMAAIGFFTQVAKLAEEEQHHPDLHLSGYRNVTVEISTHAIKGLSENDFILAAKIDEIPIEVKLS
jgi:4a-hydroxytetrahydrobiopterin dehydratase